MDKHTGPVGEISLERGKISLTRIKIFPYKHPQMGWPSHKDEIYFKKLVGAGQY